jgi:hypothetical protein
MSKQLYVLDAPDSELTDSCLDLDDDILDPLYELAAREKPAAAWRLFRDLYGDAQFSSEDAVQLAVECEQLVNDSAPILAVWLLTIAAFAREAGARGKCLRAVAD